jgi:LAO/AO transport system kinase
VSRTADSLADRLLAKDRGALARAISWAENGDLRFPVLLAKLWPRVGKSFRTGVTGPPGAGKSTLVNELARLVRTGQRTVGILAVDPSSPFTGGALLGDRIRMEERTLDPGVFIRSMASRGARGGLAAGAIDACDAMDAFGFDELLIETVGVGQAEYEVVSAADTILVVVCPGAGDAIQAMKAGLLEVADILVVNKADVPGAERLATISPRPFTSAPRVGPSGRHRSSLAAPAAARTSKRCSPRSRSIADISPRRVSPSVARRCASSRSAEW